MALLRRVACLQLEPRFGCVAENLDRAEALLQGLTADLVVLPELFATGYAFRTAAEMHALAEPFPDGATTTRLLAWSRRTGGMIVAGFAEREGGRVYNSAAVVAAGRPLGVYRKAHLFGFEPEAYAPGSGPFPVFEHDGMRVGVLVCFDWIFPEVARILALEGADVLAHPSNLMLEHCQRAMPVRAIENGVFAATANRVGREHRPPRPPLAFTGRSLVVGPSGAVLAQAGAAGTEAIQAVVDLAEARDKTLRSGNDRIAGRRPALYGRLVLPADDARTAPTDLPRGVASP